MDIIRKIKLIKDKKMEEEFLTRLINEDDDLDDNWDADADADDDADADSDDDAAADDDDAPAEEEE